MLFDFMIWERILIQKLTYLFMLLLLNTIILLRYILRKVTQFLLFTQLFCLCILFKINLIL